LTADQIADSLNPLPPIGILLTRFLGAPGARDLDGHFWRTLGISDDVVHGRPIALDGVWFTGDCVVSAPLLVEILHERRDDLVLAGRIFPHGDLS
jgi:hypothetical protein